MGCSQTMLMPLEAVEEELDFSQDFLDSYVLGMKLGRGSYATVRSCSRASSKSMHAWDDTQKNKHERAVKILDTRSNSETEQKQAQKRAQTEAYIWKAVGSHPNCVLLHDLFHGDDFCYLVMEKCQSGLLQALESMPDLTERGLGNIAGQMLLGVAHCHSVDVVHRDIKPDNFLVGGEDGVIKLADFGLSAMLPKSRKLPGAYGTAPFMCPEMLIDRSYNEKADVWSVGVVVYVLMYGQFPYTPEQTTAKAMKEIIALGLPAPSYKPEQKAEQQGQEFFRTPEAVEVIKALLDRNPENRSSAEAASKMAWTSASMQGCHMVDSELPSLRPMLRAAKQSGAFEKCDLAKDNHSDTRLNKLHVARSGIDLPESPISSATSATGGSPCPTGLKSFSNFEAPGTSIELWENSSNRSTSCDSETLSRNTSPDSETFSRVTSPAIVVSSGGSLGFIPTSPRAVRTPFSHC